MIKELGNSPVDWLSSNINESSVGWIEVLAETMEVEQVRVQLASIVVLDCEDEIDAHRLLDSLSVDIVVVLWLKSKIIDIVSGKTMDHIVLIRLLLLFTFIELF